VFWEASGLQRQATADVGLRQSRLDFRQEQAMETQKPSISPLRQRMIDDMRMRKLCDKTQTGYLRAVRQFAKYLGRSPDTATVEDLRNYQLYLVDHGTRRPRSTRRSAAEVLLQRHARPSGADGQDAAGASAAQVAGDHEPRRSARLIAAAGNLKHQTALAVAYGDWTARQ
jgi:integrase/recombinase XerD